MAKGKKSNTLTTTKKQKFVGTKILVDKETGEAYPTQMNIIQERDFNFHKVWMQHFINGLDAISNQKLRLAFWIIDHLDSENQLVMTQRMIAEKSGISYQTVSRTITELCKASKGGPAFLQKIHSGAYRVNPDVLFKGSHDNRMGICFQYVETDKANEIQEGDD